MDYLLDTNILIHRVRGSSIGQKAEQQFRLFSGDHTLSISAVTKGEILSLAKQSAWGLELFPKFGEPKPETPFISGKAIPYLGKNYKLDVVKEQMDGITFHGKFLISQQNLQQGKAVLEQWYKQRAKEKITPLVARYAKQLG